MKPRYIPPNLKVGDKCWLLRGCLSYEVTISEVRIVLEGDPHQFLSYKVVPDHEVYSYLKHDAVYRHDLFLRPAERKQMIEEIESKIESLEYLKKEIEDEEADEVEEEHAKLLASGEEARLWRSDATLHSARARW